MAEASPITPAGRSPGVGSLFLALVLAGFAFRLFGAFHSLGIVHPDEHQQYLEQAQKFAFGGQSVTFWEQDRGMRHLGYPFVLASLLWSMDAVGIDQPFDQDTGLRIILSIVVFLPLVWYAARALRQGREVFALGLLALTALLPAVAFVQVRVLTENAMTLPLMLGLLCLPRRPGLAGFLFGLMFAVRTQSAFLTIGFMLVALWDDRRAPEASWRKPLSMTSVRMGIGCLIALVLTVGLLDWLTLGGWFHSPVEYFWANIIENRAADFGVSPWYFYVQWAAQNFGWISILVPVLLVIGGVRNWRLAVPVIVMVVGHSVVGHKETRFLWGTLPLMLIMTAIGFETLWYAAARVASRFKSSRVQTWMKGILMVVVVLSFAAPIPMFWKHIPWKTEYYRSTALALDWIRQQPDVTGVALYHGPPDAGNYFYLRQDVPLRFRTLRELPDLDDEHGGQFVNYVIIRPSDVKVIERYQPEKLTEAGHFEVYRLPATDR